jgi:hypothetical protein
VAASAVSGLALASGRAAPGLSEAKLLLKYKMLRVVPETLPPPAIFPSRSSLVLAVQAAGAAACGDLELPTHAALASELAPHMRMSFSCVVDMEQPEPPPSSDDVGLYCFYMLYADGRVQVVYVGETSASKGGFRRRFINFMVLNQRRKPILAKIRAGIRKGGPLEGACLKYAYFGMRDAARRAGGDASRFDAILPHFSSTLTNKGKIQFLIEGRLLAAYKFAANSLDNGDFFCKLASLPRA